MTLGENIKFYRKQRQLTQIELAEKSNMSRSYLADIERDRYNPSVETLKSIADALNIKVASLIGDDITGPSPEMPLIPEEFTDPEKAREYVNSHQIFGSNGFDADKLDDDQILAFANELLRQMELLSYKYKK